MGKWLAHALKIRDAPSRLLLEAVKGLAAKLRITIKEEAANQLGEKTYMDDMILGGTHAKVATIRLNLSNCTL